MLRIEHLPHLLRTLFTLDFLPAGWRTPSFISLGLATGVGLFVFHASRATSYLSDDPETCTNCHVMNAQYATWQHSSHARVATCNDCHVPHDSFLAHYAFKAKDGLRHATIFTMRWESQVIRLSEGAVLVVEGNCRRCHKDLIDQVSLAGHPEGDLAAGIATAKCPMAECEVCRRLRTCFGRSCRRSCPAIKNRK